MISDFGLSKIEGCGSVMSTACGTPGYVGERLPRAATTPAAGPGSPPRARGPSSPLPSLQPPRCWRRSPTARQWIAGPSGSSPTSCTYPCSHPLPLCGVWRPPEPPRASVPVPAAPPGSAVTPLSTTRTMPSSSSRSCGPSTSSTRLTGTTSRTRVSRDHQGSSRGGAGTPVWHCSSWWRGWQQTQALTAAPRPVPAKDFIQHLMEKDPCKRFTCEQALQHPW